MKKHALALLLLLLLILPLALLALKNPSPDILATTFDLTASQISGFEQQGRSFRLKNFQGTFVSEPFNPGWEFIAVGVTWDEGLPADASPQLDVRVSQDGENWSEWVPMSISDEHGREDVPVTASELLFIKGTQVQLRALLLNPTGQALSWEGLKFTLIDSRPGPSAEELSETRALADGSDQPPQVISRAEWGANESYRFDGNGREVWPPQYYPMRAFFIHHTVTTPSEPDPAAMVRAIYYYHTVTNGWGDLGYHYLVDQYGNIYQGRYGTPPDGYVVKGAQALGYNWHTMGVAMIGDFTNVPPGERQLNALKKFLSSKADQYKIDPMAPIWLYGEGSANPDRWADYSLLGHRNTHNPRRTSCPGDQLYALLPEIRSYIADCQNCGPSVELTSPNENDVLEGNLTWQVNASNDVVRVEYFLDNTMIAASNSPPWSVVVDSRTLPLGTFTMRAVAITARGKTSYHEQTVHVPRLLSSSAQPSARHASVGVRQQRTAQTSSSRK
ncbi:MAG: N-acetylmuramoyl-L-alanine amidase [Ardenticatenaceae bacterium]